MLFKKKENSKSVQVECNHIFNKYIRIVDPKRMCVTFHLKCMLCNETISLNVTSGMLADLFNDIALNHINPIYVKALSNEKDLYDMQKQNLGSIYGSTAQNIDFPNSHSVNKTDTKDQWR